jgi:lipopolysaccharide transport system ATP-binding protein
MNSLSNENGRTLLFVSHNIDAIQKLCNNCMHLEKGKLISFGQKNQIIDSYLKKESTIFYYNHTVHPPISDLVVKLNYFDIRNLNNVLISDEKITKAIKIFIEYEILSEGYKPEIGLAIKDYNDIIILHLTASSNNYLLGIHRCEFEIPANLFNNIKLKISCGITTYAPIHHHLHHEIYFEFNDDFESITRGNYPFGYNGKLRPSIKINNY